MLILQRQTFFPVKSDDLFSGVVGQDEKHGTPGQEKGGAPWSGMGHALDEGMERLFPVAHC